MIIAIFIIVAFVILSVYLYRKARNCATNNARCPTCKITFRANDIVDETLAGDGLTNGGKNRKIIVTMRCASCGNDKKVTIFTSYRHHPTKGSPAKQYFKELAKKEWEQEARKEKKQ